jgi:hypothetical protein
MALTNASRVAITLKKVQGKSHTKTESELYNEPFSSGLSLSSKTIFAECPSTNPNPALNSITEGVVEKVRFACEYIPGTDTIAGKHAFKLSLLPNYETVSINPNKATGYYLNSAIIADAGGKLQLVPPQFGDKYIAKVYYGSIGEFTEISLTDKTCWNLDYFSGIFFQQDPSPDASKNPTYIEAYLYVGEYLDNIISAIPSSPVTTLNLLNDVNAPTPTNNQVLKYNSLSSQWEAQTLLSNSGETGATGEQGIQGIQGETGAIGPQGEQGLAGPKGDTGDLGNIGPQGPAGGQGEVGATGEAGSQGIQGVKGDTGLQGIQGIQGLEGPKGNTGDLGAAGAQGIQGIKGDTGDQGIKGDDGQVGATGTSVTIKGSLANSDLLPTEGNTNGDGYIINGDLYVWDGTTWNNVGDIQGPQGIQGIQGEAGVKGDTGSQGIQGATGSQGDTGLQGVPGAKGDEGAQGIQGIKGDTGSNGSTGATGEQGPIGIQGIKGDTGTTGAQGAAGPDGANGVDGAIGLTGPTGDIGPKGDPGIQGLQGIQGIQGPKGVTGADSIVAGPAGLDGATGAKGDTGIQGATGTPGVTGDIGPTGLQGIQGVKGDDGSNGSTGATGPEGIAGIKGDTGAQGVQGIPGATGADSTVAGPQGLKGDKGETGPAGADGAIGQQGVIGNTGAQGIQGIAGNNGTDGVDGAAGTQGIQGIQGIQGEVGPQGPSGVGGTGGVSGIERHIYEQASGSVAAKTALTIPSMDINGAIPTLLDTQVYLNGQLLIGGTNTQLANDEVDYHFSSSTEIKLVFSTSANDLIAIFRTQIGGTTLDELVGVSVDSATDNQVLTYNAFTSQWEAQEPSIGCDIARYAYEQIGSSVSAETDITIVDMDFTGITPTNTNTTLFLNGQLLVGGSTSDVTAKAVDYAFSNDTQVRFGSSIDNGDQIVIFHTTASFSTDKDFMLHTEDTAFNNARVITAGNGISISKATERQLIISNTAPPRAITELSNVYAPTPSNNQVLKYSSTTSQWEAQAESAGGGIVRYSYEQAGSPVSAETDITITGMDFTGIAPTNADTTLFLNGQLLVGGSTLDVTANAADYAFNNDTQVRFGFEMSVGDIITIFHTTTSFSTGKDFMLHTDDASFNNARVITAGDGISISKATPRELIINNTGLIQRSKTHVTSTALYGINDAFTVTNVDFSLKDYSDDRIDIFLNGGLLIKGVNYQLSDQETTLSSNQFKLIGSTSIGSGDIITAILF